MENLIEKYNRGTETYNNIVQNIENTPYILRPDSMSFNIDLEKGIFLNNIKASYIEDNYHIFYILLSDVLYKIRVDACIFAAYVLYCNKQEFDGEKLLQLLDGFVFTGLTIRHLNTTLDDSIGNIQVSMSEDNISRLCAEVQNLVNLV